ncbi:MAG: hypothetical protein HKN91_15855 [Acidimicrobiia bacterium]|nr:hypothetical protein [Acidimicrobiia bacterium]
MIEFSMPEVTQGADQSALITISDVVTPGFIAVNPNTGVHVMKVKGDPHTSDLAEAEQGARTRFSQVLGLLRAFKHGRGELREELNRSNVRDEHGNQWVRGVTLKAYMMVPGVLEEFAARGGAGLASSADFRDALRLFGKANRDGGDYSMVYEYAEREFGGPDGIRHSLGISGTRQDEFTKSVNHLPPVDGGRHVSDTPGVASMDLEDVSKFTTDLMSAWIGTYGPRATTTGHVVATPPT